MFVWGEPGALKERRYKLKPGGVDPKGGPKGGGETKKKKKKFTVLCCLKSV